jgi:(2Fe-2S) ferredoxin
MTYYKYHGFICINEREGDVSSCRKSGATADMIEYCKDRLRAEGIIGPGGAVVTRTGCMGRCAGGPLMVVYPDAVWYTFVDNSDLDEIIESHFKNGKIVERLLLPDNVRR